MNDPHMLTGYETRAPWGEDTRTLARPEQSTLPLPIPRACSEATSDPIPAPDVHCDVCRILGRYDAARGAWLHTAPSRCTVFNAIPRELRAWRAWRRKE